MNSMRGDGLSTTAIRSFLAVCMELPDELDTLLNSGQPVTEEERTYLLKKLGFSAEIDKVAIRKDLEDRFLTLKPAVPSHWLPDFQMYFVLLLSLFGSSGNASFAHTNGNCLADVGRTNWTFGNSYTWRLLFLSRLWSSKQLD